MNIYRAHIQTSLRALEFTQTPGGVWVVWITPRSPARSSYLSLYPNGMVQQTTEYGDGTMHVVTVKEADNA